KITNEYIKSLQDPAKVQLSDLSEDQFIEILRRLKCKMNLTDETSEHLNNNVKVLNDRIEDICYITESQGAMIKTNQQLIDLLSNFQHQQQTSTSVIEKLVTTIDKLHTKYDQQLAFDVTNQSLSPIFSSQPIQQSQPSSIPPLNTSSSQKSYFLDCPRNVGTSTKKVDDLCALHSV
ncbi:unnamed protein product, partial [Didymodactylos carnosus]